MTESRTATARRSAASARGRPGSSDRPDRAAAGSWPVRERSLIGPVLGIPPLVAVVLAVGLTALGVVVDLLRIGTVGTVFQIAYGAGCLLAVAWVRRRSIFLPAIQPPLLLAVIVPALAVLVGAPSSTAGVTEHLLLAGAPLINAFPAMAVTTGLVLLLAGYRLVRQRIGPDDAIGVLGARLSGRGAGGGAAGGDRAGGDKAGRDTAGRDTAGGATAAPRGGRDTGAGRARGGRPGAGRTERTEKKAEKGSGKGSEKGGAPDRARAGGRDDPARRGGSRDGGRPNGSRDRARSDDSPSDAGRRTARGTASRGGSRGGRPRGTGSSGSSDDRTRSRRPRPSDPT